jgi:hypothetical protein
MAQISLPNQLVNGTVADASQVMANFNAIVDVVNGNLESDNLAGISGKDITINDGLSGGTGVLNDFTQRFQIGSQMSPEFPGGEERDIEVSFNVPFPGTPHIFLQAHTSFPNERWAGYRRADKNGFELYFGKSSNSGSTAFLVSWLAVYAGAM